MGPCMCGDLFCSSCGPAQGNCKCSNCGRWSADGGCEDPEACDKAERLAVEAEAAYMAETEQIAEEYFARDIGGEG
jgi:hypothetical protein